MRLMTGTLLSAFAVAASASAIVIGPASATRPGKTMLSVRPPPRPTARGRRTGSSRKTASRESVDRVGRQRIGRPEDPGFATDISVNAGETIVVQDRRAAGAPIASTSTGSATTAAWAPGRSPSIPPSDAAAVAAGVPATDRGRPAVRLRELGRCRRPGRCRATRCRASTIARLVRE